MRIFVQMDKKRQEMGREERKTCGDEEGACIELESLDSLLVSIGNFRLEKTGIIGRYEISGL